MAKLVVNKERCKACGLCAAYCKQECLAPGDELNSSGYVVISMVNEDDCIGCGFCAEMCPDSIIEVWK
jgi:2-oxoglutarate ferredoxin oxidoreductase subunit delta